MVAGSGKGRYGQTLFLHDVVNVVYGGIDAFHGYLTQVEVQPDQEVHGNREVQHPGFFLERFHDVPEGPRESVQVDDMDLGIDPVLGAYVMVRPFVQYVDEIRINCVCLVTD